MPPRHKTGGGTNDRRIAVAPIVSVAGKYAHLPRLKQYLASIPIVFEFVNPVLAFGWLIDRGGKLGLNEPEPCRYAKHKGNVEVERGPVKWPGLSEQHKKKPGKPGSEKDIGSLGKLDEADCLGKERGRPQ